MKRISSWVAAIFLLLVLAQGCSRGRSDQAIANDIKAKLFSDPVLKTTNVSVDVAQGAVTISGSVPNAESQLQAFRLATETLGVGKVTDRLRIEPTGMPARVVTQLDQTATMPQSPVGEPQRVPVSPPQAVGDVNKPSPLAPAEQRAQNPSLERERPKPPEVEEVTVPAGTAVAIRMVDSIDSARNQPGEVFRASLDSPIILGRFGVIPAGVEVTVRLAEARTAGHIKGQSELELQLVKLHYRGRSYPIVSNSYEEKGSARGKETAKRTGIGAAAGAIIGALAGRGKGAAIGALVGGGGTAAYQGLTRGKQVRIASEQRLVFRLQAPLTVTAPARTIGAR